jgi:hypothetical protein
MPKPEAFTTNCSEGDKMRALGDVVQRQTLSAGMNSTLDLRLCALSIYAQQIAHAAHRTA